MKTVNVGTKVVVNDKTGVFVNVDAVVVEVVNPTKVRVLPTENLTDADIDKAIEEAAGPGFFKPGVVVKKADVEAK